MARPEAGDGGAQARVREVGEACQHPPVDLAGADVVAPAVVHVDPLVAQHPLLELGLGHQQDLPDRVAAGAVAGAQGVAARGAVDRGGLEQLPAVEDRLGVDPRRALARRADREVEVRALARLGCAEPAQHGAADHLRALVQRAQLEALGVEANGPCEAPVVGLEAVAALSLHDLLEAAVLAGVRKARVREQALLHRDRLARVHIVALGLLLGLLGLLAARGGDARLRVFRLLGAQDLQAGLRIRRLVLGHRVVLRGGAEAGVGVAVAVHVLEDHVAAELLAAADLLHDAVIGGDHGGVGLGEDLDLAATVLVLHHVGGVLAGLDALGGGLLLEVVGVAGAGGDGEASLGQPGQRADEVGGDAGDQPGAEHHRVDVPVGVVVGKDRAAHVLLIAGGLEVAAGGEDRVDGVVGVLLAVLVRVGAIGAPGGGDELHPPERAGGGDVQVAPVVGLDLVDRRQHLPPDPVLDPRRLIDRQQEDRHPELANHEIGDAGRVGGAGERVDEAGVRTGGRSVGVAQRGLGDLASTITLMLGSSLRLGLAPRALDLALGLRGLLRDPPTSIGAGSAATGAGAGGERLRRRAGVVRARGRAPEPASCRCRCASSSGSVSPAGPGGGSRAGRGAPSSGAGPITTAPSGTSVTTS